MIILSLLSITKEHWKSLRLLSDNALPLFYQISTNKSFKMIVCSELCAMRFMHLHWISKCVCVCVCVGNTIYAMDSRCEIRCNVSTYELTSNVRICTKFIHSSPERCRIIMFRCEQYGRPLFFINDLVTKRSVTKYCSLLAINSRTQLWLNAYRMTNSKMFETDPLLMHILMKISTAHWKWLFSCKKHLIFCLSILTPKSCTRHLQFQENGIQFNRTKREKKWQTEWAIVEQMTSNSSNTTISLSLSFSSILFFALHYDFKQTLYLIINVRVCWKWCVVH